MSFSNNKKLTVTDTILSKQQNTSNILLLFQSALQPLWVLPKVATSTSLLGFAVKLRHGTDGFTSPPKEGVLRIFSPEKSDGFGWV
jgi:hypothetical protein